MAPDRRTGPAFVIGHIIVGEPETGLWCRTCLLPALLRFPLFLISETGVSNAGSITRCTECDPPGGEGTGFRLPSAA